MQAKVNEPLQGGGVTIGWTNRMCMTLYWNCILVGVPKFISCFNQSKNFILWYNIILRYNFNTLHPIQFNMFKGHRHITDLNSWVILLKQSFLYKTISWIIFQNKGPAFFCMEDTCSSSCYDKQMYISHHGEVGFYKKWTVKHQASYM